jgi:hypothetical protein
VLATVKTAALAGISAVSFFGLSAASKALLTELATLAGVPLLTVGLHADDGQIGERKYEALAFRDGGETIVFLANLTSDPLELQLEIVGTRQMIFQLTGYEVRRCDKLPEPIGIIPLAESGKAGFAHP